MPLPRFSRSIALLLPAYVGLISFPSSSMMAKSSAYLLWGTWLLLLLLVPWGGGRETATKWGQNHHLGKNLNRKGGNQDRCIRCIYTFT